MKRNEGFTLVELLVSFTVGAIVALAATSVLLLGLRFNAISGGTAQRQNTTRILLTVFENLATEGDIGSVDYNYDSWKINGTETNQVLLHYDSQTQAIYSGEKSNTDDASNTILLDGVIASHVVLSDSGLLSFYVETEDGSYSSSVYCRKPLVDSGAGDPDATVNAIIANLKSGNNPPYDNGNLEDKQRVFLQTLVQEIGSTGKILTGTDQGKYYSQWYESQWPATTPWCACYVSWALAQSGLTNPPKYANVDTFIRHFSIIRDGNAAFNPQAGDIIFFDWDNGEDPEHVGVVLYVDTATKVIYTIEGNSAGIVAVRKYSPKKIEGTSNPAYDFIIGYGSMTWN